MKNTLNIIAILAIVGTVFIWILGPSRHSRTLVANPVEINVSAEQRESLALLINANLELCATVLRVVHMAEDILEVHCKLYRDQPGLGTGEKTYLIDMKYKKILR